jgi:predicted enzyme related to lactoylglutathione lyase
MSRVVHFEIHADDPRRAANFYQEVFGWHIQKWDGPAEYWLVTTGKPPEPGIDGAILQRQGPINGDAVIAYVCTVDVTSVDDTIAKITSLGGTIALAKNPVPGVGWLAYAKDSEGNIFGVMQSDHNAH